VIRQAAAVMTIFTRGTPCIRWRAGGRSVGRSVGIGLTVGGREIWSLRMRAGKKPCGSAAARARACVCARVRLCVRTPVSVCVCVGRQIHLLLKSRQTHRRKAHTRRRLESSVVFGFSSLSRHLLLF